MYIGVGTILLAWVCASAHVEWRQRQREIRAAERREAEFRVRELRA
jgi:hypothetical protein